MAIYGSTTPTPQERYLDFRSLLTSENLNKKQVKFWTDQSKFILRGIDVTYDPLTLQVTVTPGALVKDYVLIVIPAPVVINLTAAPTGCATVALQYQYAGSTCPDDCEILVLDSADFDPNTMLLLACIDTTGTVIYPDTASSCCPEPRYEFRSFLSSCSLARARFYVQTTPSSNVPLLVDSDTNKKIFIYLNGVLLHEGTDYTINRTDPINPTVDFVTALVQCDIVEQVAYSGTQLAPGHTPADDPC